jgi:hypothetical protein
VIYTHGGKLYNSANLKAKVTMNGVTTTVPLKKSSVTNEKSYSIGFENCSPRKDPKQFAVERRMTSRRAMWTIDLSITNGVEWDTDNGKPYRITF